MTPLQQILSTFRKASKTEREKGTYFEELIVTYLKHEPIYQDLYSHVWTYANFHWQSGYGIFSISPSHKSAIEKYIDNQAEHHKQFSFQDEFRRLLQRYNIQWDERYIWD